MANEVKWHSCTGGHDDPCMAHRWRPWLAVDPQAVVDLFYPLMNDPRP